MAMRKLRNIEKRERDGVREKERTKERERERERQRKGERERAYILLVKKTFVIQPRA